MGDDRDDGGAGTLLAFILGGLTGAALAILFAPRSGEETRALLNERIREGAERGRELKEKALGKGRELLDEAGGYIDRQKEGLEKRKERFTAAVEAGRQAYREEKEKM